MGTKNNNKGLHPSNIHNKAYEFSELVAIYLDLMEFVFVKNYGTETIDFANPDAVKKMNRALLMKYYNIQFWDFPDDNLCPPIPGRVDYIHHLADLLNASNINKDATVIDVGVGANCIYPLLGHAVYGWHFLGTDIDKKSIDRADKIF